MRVCLYDCNAIFLNKKIKTTLDFFIFILYNVYAPIWV